MKTRIITGGLLLSFIPWLSAAPITQGTFTEIVRDVEVLEDAAKKTRRAEVSSLIKTPDQVRTGPQSRAELATPDQTVTRVGANSVFSFEAGTREINLEKGSVLFYTPPGKGGLKIKTSGASAAVLGTTIIVAATSDGGFKIIGLEGTARVAIPGGRSRSLHAGQVMFVLPGQREFGPIADVNLNTLIRTAILVKGFKKPLPSLPLIQKEINKQQQLLATGQATDTGVSPEEAAIKKKFKSSVDDTGQLIALSVRGYVPTIIKSSDPRKPPPPPLAPPPFR